MPADYLSRNVVEAISWETHDLQTAQENDNLLKALKISCSIKNFPETQNAKH